MSGDGAAVRRPLKYPYTFGAQIAQFPYRFHFKYNWMMRYHLYAVVLCIPVFWKIGKISNSPSNVANYNEMRRKEAAGHH